MDETNIKVKGRWRYLYRAVDKAGDTIDFLFRAKRDKAAARRFFQKAMAQNGTPETVKVRFQSGRASCGECQARDAHQDSSSKVLNNVVEQDHRVIKHLTRPMLGFKDFDSAHVIPSGIEVMDMIKKGQLNCWTKAHCLPPSSSTRAFHT